MDPKNAGNLYVGRHIEFKYDDQKYSNFLAVSNSFAPRTYF